MEVRQIYTQIKSSIFSWPVFAIEMLQTVHHNSPQCLSYADAHDSQLRIQMHPLTQYPTTLDVSSS